MPQVLHFDADDYVAMIEDLCNSSDLLGLYSATERLSQGDLSLLCELARELRSLPLAPGECSALRNRAMRELNHEHVFGIPLRAENGLALDAHTPGLAEAAEALKRDAEYVERVACRTQCPPEYGTWAKAGMTG